MRCPHLAAVFITALACGAGGLEPTSPEIVSIVGVYSATTVNGKTLPALGVVSPDIPSATITASVLTIGAAHTTWSRTLTYTVAGTSQTKTDAGTMKRNGSGFDLRSGTVSVLGGLIRDERTLDVSDGWNQWVFAK